jgi:hypothetical protein
VSPWDTEPYPQELYAYEPSWTQPHYPMIPTQRIAPPADLEAPALPSGDPGPGRTNWALVGVAVACCAVLAAVATLGWVRLSDRSAASPPPPTAQSPQSPQSPQTPQQAMNAWSRNGAEALNNALRGDAAALDRASVSQDFPAAQTACESLQRDVEAFQTYGPSPDSEHKMLLAEALAQLARGATDCVAGLTANSGELTSKADAELHVGWSMFEQATARAKTISGN